MPAPFDGFSAVGSSLLVTFAVDAAIQVVFFVISALLKTEVMYDLSGALTYLSCIAVALFYRHDGGDISGLAVRQILVASLVVVWCLRLGTFLFLRVLRTPDKRFEELKQNFLKFAIPWFLQIVWIFLTALPPFIVIGNVSSQQQGLIWSDYIGLVIWVAGFACETVADTQKNIFKAKNPRAFISTGIWRYSRYANYFGEVTLWVGMFVLCAAGFTESWQWFCIISPVFVFCLIYFISGVALLEKSSEERYGSDPAYREYKARTSKFIPWFPRQVIRGATSSDRLTGPRAEREDSA